MPKEKTLDDLAEEMRVRANAKGLTMVCFMQSEDEGHSRAVVVGEGKRICEITASCLLANKSGKLLRLMGHALELVENHEE